MVAMETEYTVGAKLAVIHYCINENIYYVLQHLRTENRRFSQFECIAIDAMPLGSQAEHVEVFGGGFFATQEETKDEEQKTHKQQRHIFDQELVGRFCQAPIPPPRGRLMHDKNLGASCTEASNTDSALQQDNMFLRA